MGNYINDVFLIIILFSTVLQLAVAIVSSVITYRSTFCRAAWFGLSVAFWLMCIRRLAVAHEIATDVPHLPYYYWPELLGLALSALLLWGLWELNKCFKEEISHLTSLAEEMPVMVSIMTTAGYATYLNKRWYEYSGGSVESSLGFGWHDYIHPEDLETVWEHWQSCLKYACIFEAKARVKNKEGEYRWHVARAVPIKDEKGNVHTWFGMMTDVHSYVLNKETLYGRQ